MILRNTIFKQKTEAIILTLKCLILMNLHINHNHISVQGFKNKCLNIYKLINIKPIIHSIKV